MDAQIKQAIFKVAPPDAPDYSPKTGGLICIGYLVGNTEHELFTKWVKHIHNPMVLDMMKKGYRYYTKDVADLLHECERVIAQNDAMLEYEAKLIEERENSAPDFITKF